MDSRRIAKEIKAKIHPLLADDGFCKFTPKRAWKVHKHSIEVVYFQSFSSYLASGVGCTTFSLGVECAVYYPSVHWNSCPPTEAPSFPQESCCPARLQLLKSLSQPELARRDVWFVRTDGSNVPEVIEDTLKALRLQGLPWLRVMHDPAEAFKAFNEKAESQHEHLGGIIGSPGRKHVLRGLKLVLEMENHGAERGFERSPGING